MIYFRCADKCSDGGFSYYGLVWGNQCSCGNDIGGEQVGDSECNTPCVGDNSQMCGGDGEANPTVIYQIGDGPVDPPTEAPTEVIYTICLIRLLDSNIKYLYI